jgi:toxin ParE1/3/4
MTKRLRWTAQAAAELEEHLGYIFERNPCAAARLAERVWNVKDMLKNFPATARYDEEMGIHEYWVPGSRLKLIYIIDDERIEIIAAFHTSRDPETKPARW